MECLVGMGSCGGETVVIYTCFWDVCRCIWWRSKHIIGMLGRCGMDMVWILWDVVWNRNGNKSRCVLSDKRKDMFMKFHVSRELNFIIDEVKNFVGLFTKKVA